MESPNTRRRAISISSSSLYSPPSHHLPPPNLNVPVQTAISVPNFLVVPNVGYGASMPHQPNQHHHRAKPASDVGSLPSLSTPLGTITKPPPKSTISVNNRSAASTATMAALTAFATTQVALKGPQHHHAHHLHSIPPRDKTTRTLILDNMLWLHSRARFDQATAELAGVDSEEQSKASGKARQIVRDVSDAKLHKIRADGLEKVLSAMLNQAADELSRDADDVFLSSDNALASLAAASSQLPNGIRMRIALARIINDLYVQHADLPPLAAATAPPYLPAPPPFASLTPALGLLSRISAFAAYQKESELPKLPSFQSLTATTLVNSGSAPPAHSLLRNLPPPAGSIFFDIPRGAGTEAPWALGRATSGTSANPHPPTRDLYSIGSSSNWALMPPPAPPRVFRAVGRAKDLYNGGVNAFLTHHSEATPGMTPTIRLRCPHHLTFSCPPSSFCSHVPPSNPDETEHAIQTKRVRSSLGSGLTKAGSPLRGTPSQPTPDSVLGLTGGEASMTELVPRFLRLSASIAIELGKEARKATMEEAGRKDIDPEDEEDDDTVNSRPQMRGKGKAHRRGRRTASNSRALATAALPTREWYNLLVSLLTRAVLQGYMQKGWRGTDPVEILLGVGVGKPPPDLDELADDDGASMETSKEKYFLPDEWPNLAEAWGVLFGSGIKPEKSNSKDKGKGPSRYTDSSRYRGSTQVPKLPAYAEFEKNMADRISDFLTLPNHDLATYLDFFSRVKYKQDNADHDALKFFEAIANWRGEPELETVKRQSASQGASSSPSPVTVTVEPPSEAGPSAASTRSSSPSASQVPSTTSSIFTYFSLPLSSVLLTPSRRSRRRGSSVSSAATPSIALSKRKDRSPEIEGSDVAASDRSAKKLAVPAWGHGRAWMEPEEYVGPYGI